MLLILVTDYPNNEGKVSLMYVHTRNKYYVKHGLHLKVLNFSAKKCYTYDGIDVVTNEWYVQNKEDFNLAISHAPNIRNHFKFLIKNINNFNKIVFFFHGHEIMKINTDYCQPYFYMRQNILIRLMRDVYDEIKFIMLRYFFERNIDKCEFVFVSKWMYEIFEKNIKINLKRYKITYNCVGSDFEKCTFDVCGNKKYDFITIRSNLDGAKYAIDIVNEIAKKSPKSKFLIIGKGQFFKHFEKAKNIFIVDRNLSHSEIVNYLQESKRALMPTRTDSQGVMMCEMAAFGIPIITSDIPVAHEIFDGFENVLFIDNEINNTSLDYLIDMPLKSIKHEKFYLEKTAAEEVKFLLECC